MSKFKALDSVSEKGSLSPAFQFYPKEWLSSAKVNLMPPEYEGAYIRLLSYAWLDPHCSIPDDDEQLARLSRLGEAWSKGGSISLRKCFEPHPEIAGRLVNIRLLSERKKQDQWREAGRVGGVKSGITRRSKSNPPSISLRKSFEAKGKGRATLHSSVCSLHTAVQEEIPSSTNGYHPDARTVLHILNELAGRHYRETDFNLATISSRLREAGVTVEGVRAMISRKCAEWKGTEWDKFLQPETLFRRSKFDSYYSNPKIYSNGTAKTPGLGEGDRLEDKMFRDLQRL